MNDGTTPTSHTESTTDNTLLSRFVDSLVKWRFVLFIASLILVGFAIPFASSLQFDQSIESLYAEENPQLRDYLQSTDLFGGDAFVMVAWKQNDLLEQKGLNAVREFSAELSKVPGILPESTQNLAEVLSPMKLEDIAVNLFLRLPGPQENVIEFSRGILIGEDNETTAVILRLMPRDESPISRAETFAQLRKLADAHEPRAYVVGEQVQVHDMFRYVEQDGAVLGAASTGILLVVILLMFRSLRWMVLPLLVVEAALLWTKAVLVISQMKLSMVSSMLHSLITIVGIATVTHITVCYRDQRKTHDRQAAFRNTVIELGPAIFWTVGTTAVGFAALLSSQLTPIQSFGIMMALGTGMVLIAVCLILPGGILIGTFDPDPRRTPAERTLLNGLGNITKTVEHRPKIVGIATMAIIIWSAWGFRFLEVETDFSKNFRQASPIVQSLNFVEDNLGGAGTWEVNFPVDDGLSEKSMQKTRQLAQQIREGIGGKNDVTKVVAVTDGIDMIPDIRLPFPVRLSLKTVDEKLGMLERYQPEFLPGLYNAEGKRMRIVLRALERQPSQNKLKLIERVQKTAGETFGEAKCTGLFVLLAHLIESLLDDQLVSFGFAAAGIFLMMSIAFRSVLIGLISLVPNVFPIVLLIGSLGWLDIPINIGTAMIASVSLGLTVDSSIHYLFGYRRHRADGATHSEALRATHQGVGRALVFANVALICGFLVLTLSNFIPLVYFGVLVSVAMLGGLFGNLVLLPLLLGVVEPKKVDPQS